MFAALCDRLPLRWRAKLGVWCTDAARVLLQADKPASGDFDRCSYCRAPGCEDGTVEHRYDCPQSTGLWPISLRSLWPHGPSMCEDCNEPLLPGGHYTHRPIGGAAGVPCFAVVCVGCAARAELLAT